MSRTAIGAWREAELIARKHRRLLAAALLLVVANRLAALGVPASSRYLVDEIVGRHHVQRLVPLAIILCGAVVIESVAGYGSLRLAGLAGQRAVAGLRRELQGRLIGLPLSRIDETQTGSLAARVLADTEQIRFLVGNGTVQLIASALTAALALCLLARIDPGLTVAILSVVALLGLDVRRAFSRLSRAFERACQRHAELAGLLGQLLGGIRVVKVSIAERHEAHRLARASHALVRENLRALGGVARLNASSTLASGAIGVLVLVVGGNAVATGTMTLGSLVMFIWLTGLLVAPVLQLSAGVAELGKGVAALGRIAQLRELLTEAEQDQNRRRIAHVVGAVTFDDVSFGYVPGRLILRHVTFRVEAGSTTALIGPSGSGKSTLCRLLLGFDDPTRGRILVDGHDLATIRRRSYRAHVSAVLQDDVLFDGSVADNIRYGRPRATWPEVVAAARAAQCEEFIERLPEGYRTLVGERGVRLSGGQRQRVAIARAMLADPRVLVLDEAVSALDPINEMLVHPALRALCSGRTTFLMAHHLQHVDYVASVAILAQGMIADWVEGPELLARMHNCREPSKLHNACTASGEPSQWTARA